ncbi:MAG TPA: phosphate-starvation-inducible PsiE family protein [Candidatus Binatia bacterium]
METLYRLWRRFDALVFFNRVMDLFFKAMIVFVVLVLGVGLARLFLEVWQIMTGSDPKEAFGFTVTSLLTFFIILELFKSLIEYFREHRLKLTFIVDATLVFVLREIMIGLYQHQSTPRLLAALAFLALVLGGLRTLAIIYSPMERRLVERSRESGAGFVERRLEDLHAPRKFPPAQRPDRERSHAKSQEYEPDAV